jgi:DNA mismatch endonuclease (patch repair protein)
VSSGPWMSTTPPFPENAVVAPQVTARMSNHPRRDTAPEMRLRRELHRRGLRYRVDVPLPAIPRRKADLLFKRSKVAVFVDGCFWHGCPSHGRRPSNNSDWWEKKLSGNVRRDEDTNQRLRDQGWTVLRFWEHEDMTTAADVVEGFVKAAVRTGHRT